MPVSRQAMLLDKTNIMSAKQQRGLSLILLVFVMALVGMGLIVNFLPVTNYATESSLDTLEALNQAKLAVIGSAMDGLNGDNPGQFPCYEDKTSIGTTNEGQAVGTCATPNTDNIGRLAWRSLNMGDVRDGSGDKLWYALSRNFRGELPINSDSIAGLTVDDVANQAIAIIFSPGQILPGQSRPIPTKLSPPIVSNYLDGENSNGDRKFITKPVNASFNDRLALIKPDDIYPLLEKRVLAEIKKYLLTYKALWGAYPYPAPFSNPFTSNFIGSTSVSGGLLPIGNPLASWAGGTCASLRSSDGAVNNGTVSLSGDSLTCTINDQNYDGARTVTVNANLNNIALGFYHEMKLNSTYDFSIAPTELKTGGALSYSLNATGGGSIQFKVNTVKNATPYTIKFNRLPKLDTWYLLADIPPYIYKNNWHQLVFYKVASPFLPGGNATCGTCLTLNKWTSSSLLPITQTDVHAVLMSAGSKLAVTEVLSAPTYSLANPAQARPGSQMTDYFDSASNTSNGADFDSKRLPLSNFNDQILIVE